MAWTQAQQPRVIGLGAQTEMEMIAELLNKLPMPTQSRSATGQPTLLPPPGLSAPPGLSFRDGLAPQAGVGPHRSSAAGVSGIKDIYGFSKAFHSEQSSTNEGEHDACESLPSVDEVVHPQLLRNPTPSGGMTTLMIRNVPVMYTQEMLLWEWPNGGTYDLLYLPRTGQTNLSYAFINFVSEAHAMAFTALWHKKRLAHFAARKPLNISFADVQGLRPNLVQLGKKRVRRMEMRECQPIIIMGGRRVMLAEALTAMEA
jgi:hypothetical protein